MTVRFSIGDRVEWGDHTFAPAGRGEIEAIVGPTDRHPPHVIVRVEDTLVRESVYVSELRPADLTNDAPRRRTEPAITVPPGPCDHGVDQDGLGGFVVGVDEHGDDTRCAYCRGKLFAFTFDETEAMRAHGSAAYACMAADCDQVRELLAVEEAKAEMEAWRLENAEWLDWMTDSDATGDLARQGIEYREQFVDRWEAWLAALTPPAEGATLGDWAAAQPEPPMKWSREYMQHLYDKLRAGEVIGG